MLSHAVIEHVADAPRYLRECARVLKPGGWMYLSTAPYLSFAGAHLPRLMVPVPLHLLLGRRPRSRIFAVLARHAPWTLQEPANENSFIKARARSDGTSTTTCSKRCASPRLRGQIRAGAALPIVHEELHVTGTFRRAPGPVAAGSATAR